MLLAICYNNRTSEKGDDTMKNIELSACEEMIMTIIWNNEAELDLAAVMTQTNERYHTAWKPQTGRKKSSGKKRSRRKSWSSKRKTRRCWTARSWNFRRQRRKRQKGFGKRKN